MPLNRAPKCSQNSFVFVHPYLGMSGQDENPLVSLAAHREFGINTTLIYAISMQQKDFTFEASLTTEMIAVDLCSM